MLITDARDLSAGSRKRGSSTCMLDEDAGHIHVQLAVDCIIPSCSGLQMTYTSNATQHFKKQQQIMPLSGRTACLLKPPRNSSHGTSFT